MAEVPYVPYPQVSSTGGSAAAYSVKTPDIRAEAYGLGVGQAMSHLGATLEQSAAQVGDEVQKFQNLQNETDANNLLMDASQELGDEKVKLQSLDGQAAVDYLPTYQANVQKIRQDYLAKSNNPMVQHMLDLQLTRTAKYAMIDGAGHAGVEAKKALAASRAGVIGQAAAQASDADELSFQQSLGKVNDTVNADLADRHIDPNSDQAKQYRAQQVGQLWQNRISSKAMTDPWSAKQMLERIPPDQMDPTVKLGVQQKIIEPAMINQGARNIAVQTQPGMGAAPVAAKYAHGTAFFERQGYSHEQAIGIMNNLTHESGGVLNPAATNPGDGADGSNSIGIGQWNGKRAQELMKFANANGKDWKDYDTQLAFVKHELDTSEGKANAALKATTDRNAATEAFMTAYERPGSPQLENRIAMGQKYADKGPDPLSPQKMTSAQLQEWETNARALAEQQAPGDPRVADAAVMRVRQMSAQSDQIATKYQQEQFTAVQNRLVGRADGQNGKVPTNMDELTGGDPNVLRAITNLPPEKYKVIESMLEKNARGETVRWDAAGTRRTRYNELLGMANVDPEGFHNVMIAGEDLPMEAKNKLLDMQQNPPKQQNEGVTSALSVLQRTGFMEQAGIDPKNDPEGFHQFVGALTGAIDKWHAANPRATGAVPDDAVLKMMPELVKDVPKTQSKIAGWAAKFGIGTDTAKAFEVNPDAAATAAVGATQTIEQQLVGKGIPQRIVPGLSQLWYQRYKQMPSAEQLLNLYYSNPKIMQHAPPQFTGRSAAEARQ